MSDLYLLPPQSLRERRLLEISRDTTPDAPVLASVAEDGTPTFPERWCEDHLLFLTRELRRPDVMVAQIQGSEATPAGEASLGPADGWRVGRLYLALHRRLTAVGVLAHQGDRYGHQLLQVLCARESLRAMVRAGSESSAPWGDRATEDLLDAAAALSFFDLRRLGPWLQWLASVLPVSQAREILDGLLPVEPRFVDRVSHEPALGRIVLAIARAQRREWFLGRYQLRGAGRLRPLIAQLDGRGSISTKISSAGLWLTDLLIPRVFAGCLMGILPFSITDEAWRFAVSLQAGSVAGLSVFGALAVFAYLAYDRHQADPAGIGSSGGVWRVWWTAILESHALAGALQLLAADSFREATELCGWSWRVFFTSGTFALVVGVFTQLIWQEKAVTAPP